MAVEVAHVEAPHDRPLDLRPALPADLVEICVVPRVLDRAGEAAIAVEQARRLRDRSPPVRLPLRVQGEVHADVLAPVLGGGVRAQGTAPSARRSSRRRCIARRIHGDVGRARRAEVVAVDDEQRRRVHSRDARREWPPGETTARPVPGRLTAPMPAAPDVRSRGASTKRQACSSNPNRTQVRAPARSTSAKAVTARRRRGACRSGWERGRRPRRGCGRH